MTADLLPVALAEKAALKDMLDPYLIEHADQVDPQGIQGDPRSYDYFDPYWVDPARHPYWIVADGERVGFCLVNAIAPSGQPIDHAVAEFCIAPAHRRAGLGLAAVAAVLARHPGQWELQVYRPNRQGFAFWPRALAAAGVSDWEQIAHEDRVIHRFRAP
jgi:predicted acetyltransferase